MYSTGLPSRTAAYMEQWSRAVQDAIQRRNPKALSGLFTTDLRNSNIAVLQNELWSSPALLQEFKPQWDWPALVIFAKDYLNWCVHINPQDRDASRPLLQKMFGSLQAAFARADGWLLNGVIKGIVQGCKLELWVSGPLLRIFNSILGEREPSRKQKILLFCATRLCRIYMHKDQSNLCQTVFRSLETKDMTQFSIAEQVELRYLKGRYALRQGQIKQACEHLEWSYVRCMAGPNKQKVLAQLLLAGLLAGRMPGAQAVQSMALLDHGLNECISLLALAVKKVNFGYLDQVLGHPWVRAHRLESLIRATMPPLICRRAVRVLLRSLQVPSSLTFDQVRVAFETAGYAGDYLSTETMCINLVEMRLVYANIFPNLDCGASVLRLRPRDPIPSLAPSAPPL